MAAEKRTYRMRRRAEQQEQTRLRITRSAVELHGTVGPARTSMSALAERAGVTRSTLYRHFPDEDAVFAACSAHWSAANPAPDLGAWAQVGDPDERLRTALAELYAYYGRTRPMWENLLRDESTMPVVQRSLSGFRDYLAAAGQVLMEGRGGRPRSRRRARAAIGHALAFATWRSLVHEQGLDDDEAVELMSGLVTSAQR